MRRDDRSGCGRDAGGAQAGGGIYRRPEKLHRDGADETPRVAFDGEPQDPVRMDRKLCDASDCLVFWSKTGHLRLDQHIISLGGQEFIELGQGYRPFCHM